MVNSSNISSVGFENGTLEIEFNSGMVYQYYSVPESIFQSLLSASSKGKYLNTYIKNVYSYSKV